MTHLPLQSVVEHSGEWHLPADPSKRISGQLKYTVDRAELYLNDAFTPMRGDISVSDEQPNYAEVHGVSTTGEALTILNAQRAGVSFNFGSGGVRQPERLVSSWLVVGAHVSATGTYSKVRFFVPGLEVWLSKPGIAHSIVIDDATGKSTHTFVLIPTEGEAIQVPSINATLTWGTGTTSRANPLKHVSIEVLGWVTVEPDAPKAIEWFMDQYSKIASMLGFLAGVPMPLDAISAHIVSSSRPVSILVAMRQGEKPKLNSPGDFFVPRNSLGIDFSSVLTNWFREITTVLIPSQLAFSTLSSSNLWLHVEFLSLIQAIEGFHRGRFPGNYTDDTSYTGVKTALTAAIPASVSPDHRDALKSRIRYGNQISLSKRLNELRQLLGDALSEAILANSGKIPRSWIDTRNYLSHWDEELRPQALDGQEMYNANVRMEHFLRALYLLMMGVPQDAILNCLKNSSNTSQQLLQLNIIARRKADPSQPAGVYMTIGTAASVEGAVPAADESVESAAPANQAAPASPTVAATPPQIVPPDLSDPKAQNE